VRSWTDSVKPAWTLVVRYGDSIEWKILRLIFVGVRLSDLVDAR
jgi:hypothetical protein